MVSAPRFANTTDDRPDGHKEKTMLMNPPTVPRDHVDAPTYDELVQTLQLILHATAPTPEDDGGYHENAYTLAMDMLKRVEARKEYEASQVTARIKTRIDPETGALLRA